MFTRPISAEQNLHNALCVVTAMKSAGIDYDIQVLHVRCWHLVNRNTTFIITVRGSDDSIVFSIVTQVLSLLSFLLTR